uniref:Partner of bursicon-like n=1 Tax=Crassostrea virginica TaxID=6565 RepID=A0A8B8C1U5_CRAVI|nr:partner of bursicon-like [Crassostrea virginica]
MVTSGQLFIFFGILSCAHRTFGRFQPRETCNTEQTEMDITRTLTITHDGVLKTVDCVARVRVNECEGVCLSTASPNVHTYPDFKKECSCCKEGRLVTRQIALQECYSNGVLLAGVQPTTSITEPEDCACFPCTN